MKTKTDTGPGFCDDRKRPIRLPRIGARFHNKLGPQQASEEKNEESLRVGIGLCLGVMIAPGVKAQGSNDGDQRDLCVHVR